jgi:hypothetical protein
MNRSYNRIYTYELFYLERVGYFSETNKGFKRVLYDHEEGSTDKKASGPMEKDPSRAIIFLREDHVLKPHDSKTIRQNMLAIENIQMSIDKMEKSLKEHMEKTIHPAEF